MKGRKPWDLTLGLKSSLYDYQCPMGHGSQTGINSGSIAEASEGAGQWVWQFCSSSIIYGVHFLLVFFPEIIRGRRITRNY